MEINFYIALEYYKRTRDQTDFIQWFDNREQKSMVQIRAPGYLDNMDKLRRFRLKQKIIEETH